MIKLKPEIKILWVGALRSDDYTQTRKALHDAEGHCCLGVLCDLAVKQGALPELRWYESDSRPGVYDITDGQEGFRSSFPYFLYDWAFTKKPTTGRGLMTNFDREQGQSLACMNDQGFSFKEIADIIEKEF